MKKQIIALGIFFELIFLSFYVVKYLTIKWGVQNLFLDDSRVFTLTFVILGLALLTQIVTGIFVYKYKVSYKYIFWFSVIFNLSLLLVWNIASNDLYTHIQRGRIMAEYGASPYSVTYDHFSGDKFYSEIRTVWSGQLSIYGPVFSLFGGIISKLAGDSLLAHIFIYKVIYSILNILVGYFIYKITKSTYAAFLYSWNPLVLFEIQLNNHFEVLMIFTIVYALYLLFAKVAAKKYILGLSILTLGVLTKFFSLVIYPFYILYAFKKLKTLKQKLAFLFFGGAIQILIIFLSYLPFMDNLGLKGFIELANGTFISPSIGMFVLMEIFDLLGLNILHAKTLSQSLFKVFYVFLGLKSVIVKHFSEKVYFVKILFLVFAGFTLLFLNLALPWYTLSLVTLTCIYYGLSNEKKYAALVHILTLYSLLLYIRLV